MTTKLENIKLIGDQIRETCNKVDKPKVDDHWQIAKFSLTVHPGVWGNALVPRGFPGHPLIDIHESKQCSIFSTASGDPVPHLGATGTIVYINGGVLGAFVAQCAIVSKPLLSVKQMVEVGQFVCFCS